MRADLMERAKPGFTFNTLPGPSAGLKLFLRTGAAAGWRPFAASAMIPLRREPGAGCAVMSAGLTDLRAAAAKAAKMRRSLANRRQRILAPADEADDSSDAELREERATNCPVCQRALRFGIAFRAARKLNIDSGPDHIRVYARRILCKTVRRAAEDWRPLRQHSG